jgi:uncharacterized protein HemX
LPDTSADECSGHVTREAAVAVFAVLALATAVMIVGVAVVAGLQLRNQLRRLRRVTAAANERLAPLQRELAEETAVTTAEADRLRRSVSELGGRRRTRWAHRTPPKP